jgi:hypothetical protein
MQDADLRKKSVLAERGVRGESFRIALPEQFILTLAQAVKESLAVDRFNMAALDVIVAAVKHLTHFVIFHDSQFRSADWLCQNNHGGSRLTSQMDGAP